MSNVGRNDPCPCGSGLKHKKCCASKVATSTAIPWQVLEARKWIDLDQKLSDQLLDEIEHNPEETRACCQRLEFPDLGDLGPDKETLFGFLFHWITHFLPLGALDGRTIARAFHDSARISADMRRLLEAHLASHLTLFQAVEIEPGRGVLLNDILFGKEVFTWDVGLSNSVKPQAGLLGWVVTIDQITLVGGLHPVMLPPPIFHEVRQQLKQHKGLTRKELQSGKGETLIRLWHQVLEEWMRRPPPQMCNTDGDPLLWVEDRFTFPPARRAEVWQALLTLSGAVAHCDDTIGFSEDRPNGPMDNISVGTARVEADAIVLQTNSVNRANLLRKAVETACKGLELEKKRRKTKSFDATSAPPPQQGMSQQELMQLPEVQAKLMEIRQKMNERWLDLKNPQLDGHSPRELAKTGAGRARLQKVMDEFEYRGDPPEEVRWLKSQLGLL